MASSKSRQMSPKSALATRLATVEALEQRLVFSALTVNTVLDNTTSDSELTLRESVLLVENGGNAAAALGRSLTSGELAQIDITQPFGTADAIGFANSIAGGTIILGSSISINTAMTIDGGTDGMILS